MLSKCLTHNRWHNRSTAARSGSPGSHRVTSSAVAQSRGLLPARASDVVVLTRTFVVVVRAADHRWGTHHNLPGLPPPAVSVRVGLCQHHRRHPARLGTELPSPQVNCFVVFFVCFTPTHIVFRCAPSSRLAGFAWTQRALLQQDFQEWLSASLVALSYFPSLSSRLTAWCQCRLLSLCFQNIRSGALLSANRRGLHYVSEGEWITRVLLTRPHHTDGAKY